MNRKTRILIYGIIYLLLGIWCSEGTSGFLQNDLSESTFFDWLGFVLPLFIMWHGLSKISKSIK